MGRAILGLCSALALISGCTTTVDLQISKNEACTPSTVTNTAEVGYQWHLSPSAGLTARALSQAKAPLNATEIADGVQQLRSLAALKGIGALAVRMKWRATLRSFGLVGSLSNYLLEISKQMSTSPSTETVRVAQEAQKQVETLLAGLPTQASAQFRSGTNGSVKLGSVGRDYATKISQISRTLGSGGYKGAMIGLYARLRHRVHMISPALIETDPQTQALVQEINTTAFIEKYFAAYFRNGQFLQVSIDSHEVLDKATNSLDAELTKLGALKQYPQITEYLQALESNVGAKLCDTDTGLAPTQTCLLTQPLGTTAFVTRYGTSIQFSGETVTFGKNGKLAPQLTHLSASEIAPQLSQVLWEAVFDSIKPYVPATANSTACADGLYTKQYCLSSTSTSTLKTRIDIVDTDASEAQGAATTATGYLVRLGFWIALNNEAVAQTVEATAGVVARKVTEKLAWINENSQDCASTGVYPFVSTKDDYSPW